MNPKQNDIIKELLELDDLWIDVDEEWSSKNSGYRETLRQALVLRLTHLLEQNLLGPIPNRKSALNELKNLLSTVHLPQTTFSSQSISHCPDMGGFAITTQPSQIGFDIEPTLRITEDAPILRISSQEELDEAPSPGHLWVGKEATFKALIGSHQPQVLSEITLSHWQQHSQEIHQFQFKLNDFNYLGPGGRGVVVTSDHLKMGITTI